MQDCKMVFFKHYAIYTKIRLPCEIYLKCIKCVHVLLHFS